MNNTDKPSTKLFATAPNGESIVAMVNHKDTIIVATASNVYQLSEDGVFTMIMFKECNDEYIYKG